jgi:hypothetical protein
MVSNVLIGNLNPWVDPGFIAFQAGFNITLNDDHKFLKVRGGITVDDFYDGLCPILEHPLHFRTYRPRTPASACLI